MGIAEIFLRPTWRNRVDFSTGWAPALGRSGGASSCPKQVAPAREDGDARRMTKFKTRPQRSYDHRLRELVRVTGDISVVAEFGVPRSTAVGWLRGQPRRVITSDVLDMDHARLQVEVLKLRQRIRRLGAVIRLLLALVRALGGHLDQIRLPEGATRGRLLRAIGCAERVLTLQGALAGRWPGP